MGCNTSKETATNQNENEQTKNDNEGGGGDGKEREGVAEEKHVETGKYKRAYQFHLRLVISRKRVFNKWEQ